MSRRGWGILIAVLILAAAVGGAGGRFYFRAPVLVVTDNAFEAIYGGTRSFKKRVEIALALFRPVKSVRIGDDVGADVVAFAVEAASSGPYCALFPSWYQAGALRYQEEHPGVPVVILGGQGPAAERPLFIESSREADYYRAGRCAAVFAAEGGGEILFFQGETLTREDRGNFERGLGDGGWAGSPRYLSGGGEQKPPEEAACAVVAGIVGEQFWKGERDVPVILFSWLDPALTPRKVKVVFDDSPWALAARAAGLFSGEAGPPLEKLPGEVKVLDRRLDKAVREKLREVLETGDSPSGIS